MFPYSDPTCYDYAIRIDTQVNFQRWLQTELETSLGPVTKVFKQKPLSMKNTHGSCAFNSAMELVFNCESIPKSPRDPENDLNYVNSSALKPDNTYYMLKAIIKKYKLKSTCQVVKENDLMYKYPHKKVLFVTGNPSIGCMLPTIQCNYVLTGVIYECLTQPIALLDPGRHAVSLIRENKFTWLLYSNEEKPIHTRILTECSIVNNSTEFRPIALRYEYMDLSKTIEFQDGK